LGVPRTVIDPKKPEFGPGSHEQLPRRRWKIVANPDATCDKESKPGLRTVQFDVEWQEKEGVDGTRDLAGATWKKAGGGLRGDRVTVAVPTSDL
jgi:hypothetical protein